MSKLLIHVKEIIKREEVIYIVEIKSWEVSKSKDFPEGIKYSLALIKNNERILGYDNERGKGHHKHIKDKETEIRFTNFEQLLLAFQKEVEKLIK